MAERLILPILHNLVESRMEISGARSDGFQKGWGFFWLLPDSGFLRETEFNVGNAAGNTMREMMLLLWLWAYFVGGLSSSDGMFVRMVLPINGYREKDLCQTPKTSTVFSRNWAA